MATQSQPQLVRLVEVADTMAPREYRLSDWHFDALAGGGWGGCTLSDAGRRETRRSLRSRAPAFPFFEGPCSLGGRSWACCPMCSMTHDTLLG
jgi:hypothetical protein